MKPFIGVTASILHEAERDWSFCHNDYLAAVREAGGIPVLIPCSEETGDLQAVLDRVEGVLIIGGVDVDPLLFDEQPLPGNGAISPQRDATELALAKMCFEQHKPILGICRGHQVMGIAAGGRIYQDIYTQTTNYLKHSQKAPRWHATHAVNATPGSKLSALFGERFNVNSFHHQAVRSMPEGWLISGVADDGICEAIESVSHPFAVGVQWHPEMFTGRKVNQGALFEAFVAACRPVAGSVKEAVAHVGGC